MTDIRSHSVDDQSMAGMLRWQATHNPGRTAIVCGANRRSWAGLDERTDRLATGLLARGLAEQDRVAILLGNSIEFIELYYACAKAGLVAVPINTQLTGPETAYILADSGAKILVSDRPADLTECSLPRIAVGATDGVIGYEELIANSETPQVFPPVQGQLFFQGYTSGTTGQPKGCLQTRTAFVAHFHRSFQLYRHDANDIMLMPGPLFHEAPALFSLAQLFYGGMVVVLPRFAAVDALTTIEQERITLVGFAVPTMLDQIAAIAATHDTSSLRGIIVAGAPLREETRAAVLGAFPTAAFHEFYGATEIGIITSIDHRREPGPSTGQAVPGSAVAVLDDNGARLPAGEVGQVYVTPVMMAGYHRRPSATAEATRSFSGVDWFTLGDLGRLDPNGYLHLVDRKTNMIISGGENIYPAEVENVLAKHPAIHDVAVLGLPDSRWGEIVTAVIVAHDEIPSAESLKEYCRDRLAGYKIPKQVIDVADIPRTASGKILKHQLRQQLLREHQGELDPVPEQGLEG